MSNSNIPYGQNYTSIDKKTLGKMTVIIEQIYPMVISKTWTVNKLYAESKVVIGSTVELDANVSYSLDIVGGMRVTEDALFYGNVSINNVFFVNNASIVNASISNVSINRLYVNYLDIDITDLNISENLYVNNNVSINGYLYNFSKSYLNYLNVSNDLTIGGNITHFSDIKLKTNIIKLENSLNKLSNINGYTYNRIDFNNNKTHIGLIAQEVEKEYPEIVEYTNDIRSINYQSITAILIESIKELNAKITKLENIINKT